MMAESGLKAGHNDTVHACKSGGFSSFADILECQALGWASYVMQLVDGCDVELWEGARFTMGLRSDGKTHPS
jgi:hypothetical protein